MKKYKCKKCGKVLEAEPAVTDLYCPECGELMLMEDELIIAGPPLEDGAGKRK